MAIQNGIKNNKNGNVWAKIFNDFRNLQQLVKSKAKVKFGKGSYSFPRILEVL